MKNKKIAILFLSILIIILIGGYFIIKYVKGNEETAVEEYTPQEEITEEQARQTIVSLYFPSKENDELSPEARLIDIREILNNPYEKLINLLIDGPKSDKNKKVIPEKTKVNKTYLQDDCVVLDLSKDVLSFETEKEKNNIINSIVNTLTELTEVNSVKILIDGQENSQFSETYQRKKG